MDTKVAAPPNEPPTVPVAAVAADEPGEPAAVTYDIDFAGPWTFAEIARAEDLTGLVLPQWFDGEHPEGTLRQVLTWTLALRADPDASLAAFARMKMRLP